MFKSMSAALVAAGAALFVFQAGPASAATYNLILTDSSNTTYSGTGTLIVVGTPAADGMQDQYCLNNSCGHGTLTSLTFSVDGFNFSSADSGASGVSATFTNGILTALGLSETDNNNDQLHAPQSGGLTYSFNSFNNPSIFTTGVITFSVAATPLPATLPLFAGGLGFVGYLTRRKKRAQAVAG
jgi:hypothetical protein